MGLFGKKKNQKQAQQEQQKTQNEMKIYIQGAGGTIVTKSILDGTSKLKWMFRQESEHGNGWVAFGDTDSQEYVDDAKNMTIVDFNTLANIEPTVVNIFYMPVGSDLEFRSDKTGKYFVDTRTGKEIREPVKHPAQLSVCLSRIAGLRIAAARLLVNSGQAVSYEIAMPRGKHIEEFNKPGVFTFFGVDTGLACFADRKVSEESRLFFEKWAGKNPGKDKYADYFASLFHESYEANPKFQNQGGSFLEWKLPESGFRTVLFSSGMGDGVYSGYWGLDEKGEIVCLVAIFMNPEYF